MEKEFRSETHYLLGSLRSTEIHTLTVRVFLKWKGNELVTDNFTFKGTDFRFSYPYGEGGVEVSAINATDDSPTLMKFKDIYDYRID